MFGVECMVLKRHLSEVLRFRALTYALVRRYLAIRYRGSSLGFFWSLLNPLCLMAVYTLVFHYYIRFESEEHYSIYLFCGLLPWMWIASSITESSSAIVTSGHLVTKSAFPAHVLPAVQVVTNMVHFVLALPVLVLFMMWAGMSLKVTWVQVPLITVLTFFFLYGIAVGLAALNVFFRDVQHVIANAMSLLFFLCPVVYSASTIPERHRALYMLNPCALIINTYHQAILDGVWVPVSSYGYILLWVLLVNLIGHGVYDFYREDFAEML
jgi:lipopolysaccharide transport system permease protein